MTKTWTLEVKQHGDDFYIELNDEILKESGFRIGDTVRWKLNEDGSATLESVNKKYVVIETVSSFKMRYALEVDEDTTDEELKEHTKNFTKRIIDGEVYELSQQHLGETVDNHFVLNRDEVLKLIRTENPYITTWSDDFIIQKMTNRNLEDEHSNNE